MKRNRLLTLFSFLFIISGLAYGQTKMVSGVVTDKSTGELLPGVNIIEEGTTNGTVTDIDGKYSIEVAEDANIIVSFIGFDNQVFSVAGTNTINAALGADFIEMEEVVAVGYGTVKKRDVTGSVGSISSKDLLKSPISSLDAGLKGKMAGVQVQQTSGAPGQAMKIRVRGGGGSISYGNEPLYVVDGFIGADMTTINPSDIASIDILKDASATAVYGSRGANGVILITTNAPKEGSFTVSVDANVGVSNMVNDYELLDMDTHVSMLNDRAVFLGNTPYFDLDGTGTPTNPDDDIAGKLAAGPTEWVDAITRQGIKQNYTVNINGGSEKIKYYFSANHLDDKGVIDQSFYKRTGIRSNISYDLADWLNVKFNAYGNMRESQNNQAGNNGVYGAIGRSVIYPYTWDSKDESGEYLDWRAYPTFNGLYAPGGDFYNPTYINDQNQETKNESLLSNLDVNIDLPWNFSLFISGSGEVGYGLYGARELVGWAENVNDRSSVTARQARSRGTAWTNTNMLNYENDFGKHHIKVSGLYEFQKKTTSGLGAAVNNLPTLSNEWYLLDAGSPVVITSYYNLEQYGNYGRKMRSYMGRLNYSFADKYLITASLRADGTGRVTEDKRWGYFPSAAFAWRMSEEGFIKGMEWIHNLKFRAGYGEVGNMTLEPYKINPGFDVDRESGKRRFTAPFDMDKGDVAPADQANDYITAVVEKAPIDREGLQWETQKQGNVGIDFGVMRGRLSTTIDYYSKSINDLIVAKRVPYSSGASNFVGNFASSKISGIEVAVNLNILDGDNLRWDVNGNLATAKSEVIATGNDGDPDLFMDQEETLGMFGVTNKFVVRKGEALGSIWGLQTEGDAIWQEGELNAAGYTAEQYGLEAGEVQHEDTNGDGVIDSSDRQIIGK